MNIGQIVFSETLSTCLGCERWKSVFSEINTVAKKHFMKAH
jgi:hypothetical protein